MTGMIQNQRWMAKEYQLPVYYQALDQDEKPSFDAYSVRCYRSSWISRSSWIAAGWSSPWGACHQRTPWVLSAALTSQSRHSQERITQICCFVPTILGSRWTASEYRIHLHTFFAGWTFYQTINCREPQAWPHGPMTGPAPSRRCCSCPYESTWLFCTR